MSFKFHYVRLNCCHATVQEFYKLKRRMEAVSATDGKMEKEKIKTY